MRLGYAVAAVLLLTANAAAAQTAREDLTPKRGFTVIPNVGAVPGVIVTYQSLSKECQTKADAALAGTVSRDEAVAACDTAISSGALEPFSLAGSLVNRGALFVATDFERAKQDFTRAITAVPYLPEAYLNRGAVLVAQGRAAEGVADLDKAIELGASKPEQAYFNRGIGREMMSNIRGAYADYKMAASLNPAWTEPQTELARFQVVTP